LLKGDHAFSHKTKYAIQKDNVSQTDQIERYRLLVESIQDYAIFLLDPAGNVASWNAGAKRFKGYNKEEIIGKHFSVFYPQEDVLRGKPQRVLNEAKKFGRVEDEGWRIRKDGTRFWADVVVTALYEEDGTLRGFAKVTRDLTERKHMEDELVRANTQLKHQQEELTILNQVKDEFISLASHQLRTPATGVKQYLGLLLQGFLGDMPKEQKEILEKAYASNERQIELINDLLRIAQLDAGKIILKKAPIDITNVLKDVIAEQNDSFKKRQQNIEIQVPPKAIVANIDSRRFRMVLDNLVDNASKYTPNGGEIKVSLKHLNGCLCIEIRDNGVGIKEEDISKLFTKFTRIGNMLSDEVGGSGLGLYWANKVVQLHNGYIEVESKVDKGTKFSVIIPRGESNA
jgi:PAS domain S-box-containing protein